MTQKRGPDLRRLLPLAMDGEPARSPAQALALARRHRLPIEATAVALGVREDPLWSAAVAEERARAEVRAGTCALLEEALRPLLPALAIEGLPWRPLLGTDVDLLVPARLFAEVRERLTRAGLVEVGWHAGPGRAALARIGADGAVDLVDVECVPEESFAAGIPRRDLHTGPHQGTDEGQCADLGTMRAGRGVGPAEATAYAGLLPEAARERLCRAVAARGVVRLRDLADADALDLFAGPPPAGEAFRGWELLRDAARDGVQPDPPGPSRRRGPVERAGLVLRLPRAVARGRSVRILCTGPTAGQQAAELAADLRALAIEVVLLLDRPGPGAYLRAVLRGAADDAVVVTAVGQRPPLFPWPTLTAGPAIERSVLLRQILQRLAV